MTTGSHSVSPDGQALATRAHERARRPVVGYAANYPDGWRTGLHLHPRAQLLTATGGVMRVEAEGSGWIVPPGTGLFVPAQLTHRVAMDGVVQMRALFLRADAARTVPAWEPGQAVVIAVGPLLRELILAACAEPLAWDLRGRGRHLAALALDEIIRAEALPLALPMPRDARARRVADALRAAPGDGRDLAAHGAATGASARTLARLFRWETGMSFAQWRQRLRLAEALAVLAAGGSRAAAMRAAGYASGPAFGAAFRAAFGRPPGEMRRPA